MKNKDRKDENREIDLANSRKGNNKDKKQSKKDDKYTINPS